MSSRLEEIRDYLEKDCYSDGVKDDVKYLLHEVDYLHHVLSEMVVKAISSSDVKWIFDWCLEALDHAHHPCLDCDDD